VAGKNVLQLAQQLLERFGGLSGLLHTAPDDLKAVKGMGGSASSSASASAAAPRAMSFSRGRASRGRSLNAMKPCRNLGRGEMLPRSLK